MSEKRDSFSKIVENKLNKFEVPYNESHWSEMSQKLDGFKPISGSGSGPMKKIIWAAAAGIIAIGAWYFIDNNNSPKNDVSKEVSSLTPEDSFIPTEPATITENTNDDIEESKAEIKEEKKVHSKDRNEAADNKLEHYAQHTEDQVKIESEDYVAGKIKDQEPSHEGEAVINYDLKTVILTEKETFCVGEYVEFNIDTEIEGAKYYWDFGDKGLTSRKARPKHKFKKPGIYDVVLYVAKGEIGDKNDFPAYKTVVVNEIPEIEINIIDKEITLNDPYAEFEVVTNCSCKYEWGFNSNNKSEGKEVFFLVPDRGSFPINLIATNEFGCENTVDEFYHASKGVLLDVETGYTPDGNDLNDVFLPKELTISNVDFTFIVRDMSGQVVFQTNDKNDAWNGKLNNSGNQLPDGTFIWQLSFTDDRGKVHDQKGKITLR